MNLTFQNRRFVPALDYEDPIAEKGPWLDPRMFTPGTKEQLRLLVEGFVGSSVPDDALFSGGYDTFQGMCEVPLEWWDVVDDEGIVRYQLWFYCADSGVLFENESLKDAGAICQGGFDSEDVALGLDLEDAYEKARTTEPATELVMMKFAFGS